jgi:hypothetical protein
VRAELLAWMWSCDVKHGEHLLVHLGEMPAAHRMPLLLKLNLSDRANVLAAMLHTSALAPCTWSVEEMAFSATGRDP